eukprot:365526-Chlamydomonas_euryale.AAC.13
MCVRHAPFRLAGLGLGLAAGESARLLLGLRLAAGGAVRLLRRWVKGPGLVGPCACGDVGSNVRGWWGRAPAATLGQRSGATQRLVAGLLLGLPAASLPCTSACVHTRCPAHLCVPTITALHVCVGPHSLPCTFARSHTHCHAHLRGPTLTAMHICAVPYSLTCTSACAHTYQCNAVRDKRSCGTHACVHMRP